MTDAAWPGYRTFDRDEWARLRANTPLSLAAQDLAALRGLNDRLDLDEVTDVYLPLSRLLNLRVAATQTLHQATDTFLGRPNQRVPFIIGLGGSVAVGKSTTARVLQALLARWPDHPKVDLVTTDGFLRPNRVLEERGIMDRKGFPESYDVRTLVRFLEEVKRGEDEVRAPVYSHVVYDIVDGEEQVLRQPDIVILEGLNVLQTGVHAGDEARFVSDWFDFSIYVDADEADIERWYVERFFALRETAFNGRDLVLPPLRGHVGRGAADHGPPHLGDDQPPEPAGEHPAEPIASRSGAREGRRPRGAPGSAPPALVHARTWVACVTGSSVGRSS